MASPGNAYCINCRAVSCHTSQPNKLNMNNIRLILVFVLLSLLPLSQSCKENPQYVYRATEGHWDSIKIDHSIPLRKLIPRLENPWEFIETGKAYWIGYTNDMFFIASYKDKAVKPLIRYINSTDSLRAKIGGLYTLHLIGIESTIAGRFIEEFKDTLARRAILSFVNDKDLHVYAVSLLMRDPWNLDISTFMNYLSQPGKDYKFILSALARYTISDQPFSQIIPETILSKNVKVATNQLYSRQPIHDMVALKEALGDSLVIDDEVLNSPEWQDGIKLLKSDSVKFEYQKLSSLIEFLSNSVFSYVDFSNRFFYQYRDGKILIYGPNKARDIWLDWWLKNKVKYVS
jgi:hypothetical protein